MIPGTRLRIAALMLPLLAATGAIKTGMPGDAEVVVIGTDYAFQLPPHIKAGPTLIAFENHGRMRHELAITLLRPGVAADSTLRAIMQGTLRRREVVEGLAGLLIGGPGERSDSTAGPRLWLRLERGRTYLVTCTLADRPGQPTHATLGMVGSFTAE